MQISLASLQEQHQANKLSRQIENSSPPQTTISATAATNGTTTFGDESIAVEWDRAGFRLDGLEVYAVVSALTLATSIQFFELLSDQWQWGGPLPVSLLASGFPLASRLFFYAQHWFGIATDFVCLLASATGMITGLHSTLVFSLMTVYGRTAVGSGWDDSFQQFFRSTGQVRFRGFRSFRASLYTFLVQILFIIVSRLPPRTRVVGAMVLTYTMWCVYKDTQFIINKAGPCCLQADRS